MRPNLLDDLNRRRGLPLRLMLVMPKFPPSFWGMHYVARWFGRTCMMPPLGLLTIAAMCPPEWSVRVVDQNTETLTDEDIAWADVVGVTAMVVQYGNAVRVARRAHRVGKPAIVGGPHATGEPEAYEEEFDVLVLNEGEITFRRFIEDYMKGTVAERYQTREEADLTQTPVARYDLLRNPRRYVNFTLQFSRGCPYGCDFCDVTSLLGRRHRTLPIEHFLAELEAIRATGYHGPIFLADDNFAVNKRKAIELCEATARWNKKNGEPFTYYTEMSLERVWDDDLLEALEKAGFTSMYLGLETPSQESLQRMGKSQNVGVDVREAVLRLHRHGIRVDSGFIVGFDGDMPDIFDRQARFIEEIGVSTAMVGILCAPPRTELKKRLKSEGRLLFERTPLQESSDDECPNVGGGYSNVIPMNFSRKELMEGYSRLLANVYSPRRYFNRVLKQVSTLKPDHRFLGSTLKWNLIAFPLLTLVIILFYPWRFDYLRATIQMLRRWPRSVKEFAFLSMCGIHYIEFTRRRVLPWATGEIHRLAAEESMLGAHSRHPESAGTSP